MTSQIANVCDVSVLVTAYNQNSALDLCLRALQQQDFEGSWEIIVCDDGSDEDTLSVIRHAAPETSPPIRYIWQSRQGRRVARSRNNGLRCASGRIIIFLDGDMVVRQNFVSAHVACHTGGRTVVCGARYWLFFGDLPEGSMTYPYIEPLLLLEESDVSCLYSEIWLQERNASSGQPWAACWGCNFSYLRDGCPALFDEMFVGWGSEDQEFACCLQEVHHYDLRFVPSLFGFHLDQGKRSNFTHVRVRSHSEIADFIRNLVRLCELYPMLDMAPCCIALGHFERDPERDLWQLAREPSNEASHIRSLFIAAEKWVSATRELPRSI